MFMGADYSFELLSIETYAPQLIGHNKLFLGSVNESTMYKSNLMEYIISTKFAEYFCYTEIDSILFCSLLLYILKVPTD